MFISSDQALLEIATKQSHNSMQSMLVPMLFGLPGPPVIHVLI